MQDMQRLASCLMGLILGIILAACSREPRFLSPKLGEVIAIQPIAVNMQLSTTPAKSGSLKLNIMWGGRMLSSAKGDTTLNFYDKAGKIRYSKTWSQLENAYRDTDCSNRDIATLDGALMGSALICDGSLNLGDITAIEGIDAKGDKRSATSWATYMVNEDVAAVSIGLY